MSEATPGPWTIKDSMDDRGRGYLEIRGPNDEAVLTMFPLAGKGGVGVDIARENASLIVRLINASRETARSETVRAFNEWTPPTQ